MSRPKRVVVAHEIWFGSTGSGIVHGLRSLGADVFEVDQRTFTFEPRDLLARAAYRALLPLRIKAYNKAVIDAVSRIEPDAFLTIKGVWLRPATLQEIGDRGVTRINYYPDFHFGYPEVNSATFALYDKFLTTKSFQVEHLNRAIGPERVAFLHHGYSDNVHFPRHQGEVLDDDYLADVTYLGRYTPYKEKWLSALARFAPQVKLKIVGAGWEAARDASLRGSILGHQLSGDFYARAIQSSRINLAVHMGPVEPKGWQDLVSTRTFEIPACKGFMLHIDNEEVRGLFEVGREIDVFGERGPANGEGHLLPAAPGAAQRNDRSSIPAVRPGVRI